MSILVRRPTDDRDAFSAKWQYHGTLVSALPRIRSYIQNHVVEDVALTTTAPLVRADGLVELRFDTADDMHGAFASDAARPVKADEPNFLGHGTGYVMAVASAIRTAEDGSKLVVAMREADPAPLSQALAACVGCTAVDRDDVAMLLPRPEMAEPPQRVDVFLHAYFASVTLAVAAANDAAVRAATPAGTAAFRVRTLTFI